MILPKHKRSSHFCTIYSTCERPALLECILGVEAGVEGSVADVDIGAVDDAFIAIVINVEEQVEVPAFQQLLAIIGGKPDILLGGEVLTGVVRGIVGVAGGLEGDHRIADDIGGHGIVGRNIQFALIIIAELDIVAELWLEFRIALFVAVPVELEPEGIQALVRGSFYSPAKGNAKGVVLVCLVGKIGGGEELKVVFFEIDALYGLIAPGIGLFGPETQLQGEFVDLLLPVEISRVDILLVDKMIADRGVRYPGLCRIVIERIDGIVIRSYVAGLDPRLEGGVVAENFFVIGFETADIYVGREQAV